MISLCQLAVQLRIKQVRLAFLDSPVSALLGAVVVAVVVQVAPLAQCCQVVEAVVPLVLVYMRHCEYHGTPCVWMRFTVFGSTPFTPPPSTVLPYEKADLMPSWVIFLVVNRHFNTVFFWICSPEVRH